MATTNTPATIPSYDDVTAAFARIRREGGVLWDVEHPLRDFAIAAGWVATVTRDAERMAAYRLLDQPAPLGYYDDTIDKLHLAIELLRRQRAIDHGDAPVCLDPVAARSQAMREAVRS